MLLGGKAAKRDVFGGRRGAFRHWALGENWSSGFDTTILTLGQIDGVHSLGKKIEKRALHYWDNNCRGIATAGG